MKYLGAILLLLIGLNSCKETAKKENVPEMDIPIVEVDLAKALNDSNGFMDSKEIESQSDTVKKMTDSKHNPRIEFFENLQPLDWPSDSQKYKRFQYFDIFSLKAYGNVVKEPFVFIREYPGFKIVRVSDDVMNPYLFKKIGNYWIFPRERFMYKDKYNLGISEPHPHRVLYFIRNDTIYKFQQMYSDDDIYKSIGMYTKEGSISFQSPNITEKETNFTAKMFSNLRNSLKKYVRKYNESLDMKSAPVKFKFLYVDSSLIKVSLDYLSKSKSSAYKMYDYPILILNDHEFGRGPNQDFEYVPYSVYGSLISPSEYIRIDTIFQPISL